MNVEATECPTLGRLIEFHSEDEPGSDAALLKAAAEWLESPNAHEGQFYDEWIVTGMQMAKQMPGFITLQLFVLPVPHDQGVDDAVG